MLLHASSVRDSLEAVSIISRTENFRITILPERKPNTNEESRNGGKLRVRSIQILLSVIIQNGYFVQSLNERRSLLTPGCVLSIQNHDLYSISFNYVSSLNSRCLVQRA